MSKIIFPKDFLWGTATSSYQIEGAYNEDGKGESIWDRFSHEPGKIKNNENGDIACDHYHLYKEDIKLLKQLGVNTYRFSISWPRVFPEGKGKINKKGIDFYKRLTDSLLQEGIKPAITLYHWDLPQKLQLIGGWANREITDYFEHYSEAVFKELGDIVPIWMTHNEPQVVSCLGNELGIHAPGIKDISTALAVSHDLLLSHGKSLKVYRDMGFKGEIGIAVNTWPIYPASESKEDRRAADICNSRNMGWYLDPIFKGQYPKLALESYKGEAELPVIQEGDMELISAPIDFLGINYYSRNVIKHDARSKSGMSGVATESEKNILGWDIYPQGLYDVLTWLNKEYNGIKMMITENGRPCEDRVNKDGRIDDENRIDYIKNHLIQANRAIYDGVNLTGYYLWSFMDNFEWAEGYWARFGMVHVDFETLKRTVKDSGYWYQKVIKENGLK
jgi:beta-glucosidase